MAKQPHELKAYPQQGREVSHNVQYLHCMNVQDADRVNKRHRVDHSHQPVGDLQPSAANCFSGTDHTISMNPEDPGGLQPCLKIKVHCRVFQNTNQHGQFAAASHAYKESDGVKVDQCTEISKCNEQTTECLIIANDEPEMDFEAKDQKKEWGFSREGSSGPELSVEEALTECVTPTAREQRISESTRNLVCPPPPMKKKPTAFKRIGCTTRSSEHRRLLVNPPDLDELPDCIRALFDK